MNIDVLTRFHQKIGTPVELVECRERLALLRLTNPAHPYLHEVHHGQWAVIMDENGTYRWSGPWGDAEKRYEEEVNREAAHRRWIEASC